MFWCQTWKQIGAICNLNTQKDRQIPCEGHPFTSCNHVPCFHRMFKEGQKLRTINSERDDDEMMV